MVHVNLNITENIEVKADKLILRITTSFEGMNYDYVFENGTNRTNAVLEKLNEIGVEKETILVSNVSVRQRYKTVQTVEGKRNNSRQEVSREPDGFGYSANICITLDVGNPLASKIYCALLSESELVCNIGYSYEFNNMSKNNDDLTRKIIQTGLHKAKVIAEELNLENVTIDSIGRTEEGRSDYEFGSRKYVQCESFSNAVSMDSIGEYMFTEDSVEKRRISDTLSMQFLIS